MAFTRSTSLFVLSPLLFSSVAARRAFASRRVQSVDRNLPPVTMTMNIPLAGSLQHIFGSVEGLVNPQNYRFCVYLESDAQTFNGPKPFEDEGSFSPISPEGNYDYVDWWANDVFDVVTPRVFGFIWPNANGDCLPTMGGPEIPPRMFTDSAIHIEVARVSTMNLAVDPPLLNQPGIVNVVITGIPQGETAAKYRAMVYARTPQGLVGPLPACGNTHALIQDPNDATRAQIHIDDWAQGAGHAGLVTSATGFRVALVPEPYGTPDATDCLNGAAIIPVSSPVIVEAEAARVAVVVPSASPSPSSSSTPAAEAVVSPSPSASASASADIVLPANNNNTSIFEGSSTTSGASPSFVTQLSGVVIAVATLMAAVIVAGAVA